MRSLNFCIVSSDAGSKLVSSLISKSEANIAVFRVTQPNMNKSVLGIKRHQLEKLNVNHNDSPIVRKPSMYGTCRLLRILTPF